MNASTPNFKTPAEIERETALISDQTADLVQMLSLSVTDTSLIQQIESYQHRGLRLPIILEGDTEPTLYIYALTWSRGWSVFISNDPHAGVYSWRDVPNNFRAYSIPIYTPRDTTGAWRCDTEEILSAILRCVDRLEKYNNNRKSGLAAYATFVRRQRRPSEGTFKVFQRA